MSGLSFAVWPSQTDSQGGTPLHGDGMNYVDLVALLAVAQLVFGLSMLPVMVLLIGGLVAIIRGWVG